MRYVNAQFSLKFEPQAKIRRSANQIEDFLEEYYLTPQTTPIPDGFAAEAPRVILDSKHGHSQISFSQISVDLAVKFDGDFANNFDETKDYILKRLDILKRLLVEINIKEFYFAGLSYNVRLDTGNKRPLEYMENLLHPETKMENSYEISQKIVSIKDNVYFINQQIGTVKEYQSSGNSIPDLMNLSNSKMMSEGVNLALDINNRYEYITNGLSKSIDEFDPLISKIYKLIDESLSKWR